MEMDDLTGHLVDRSRTLVAAGRWLAFIGMAGIVLRPCRDNRRCDDPPDGAAY